ncbi:DUF429 domain-containing protein [Ignicoccus hospitalis]|uniref:DUF429 domain-containing protein n=1 Tax=Ignicoccus hospitalis (strain KIN4/I / DSM 18386 / JCM 14125) TaxID=453591 RepID=A8A9V3_IGNH4|nr:DUF429 domain-containing protein [Ignicoccus hospitalis]ABU81705.1 Protein of unknown function DUF429 [Ignicoccus hospitalis KIN4/I]HIH89969.1 DUF429 domain-containing protein [Desulfurococcaceae archaeon]
MVLAAGVDLAVKRPSALAIFDGSNFWTKFLDNEALAPTLGALRPELVAVDAPLEVPEGTWREVDLVARKAGLKVLPPGWRGMRALAEEGKRLREELVGRGIKVIETFPAPLRKLVGLPFEGDLLDAALCALTAYKCLRKECYYVRASDGEMALPVEAALGKSVIF